jgi:ceramide glucosyltransferase
MSTYLVAGLLCLGALSLTVTLANHFALRRLLARRTDAGRGHAPAVSVLKPLKGLDDGLYENLASFARQEYPEFELVCGSPDRDDPAIGVVERLKAEFPGVPVSVAVCERPIGRNPKVNTLASLLAAARHEHVLISDSNVRVATGYLRDTVAELADPRVGLVTNPIAGVGERTVGAAFENAHLGGFVAGAVAGAALFAGRPIVIGKSMLFRRRDLEALGGLRAVRHVLAEDYVLGRRFERAGHRVAISPHAIATVNETWPVGRFVARHLRWGQLRRRIAPAAYLAEPLLNPVPWLAALAAAGVSGLSLGPLSSAGLVIAAAAGTVAKVASDALLVRRLRGIPLAPTYLALVPLKDLLVAAIWAVAAFRRTVEWRGTPLRIGPGSRLLRPRAPAPRRSRAHGGRAEVTR